MKKIYILFAFLLTASFSKATTHLVVASGMSFTPASVTAVCGDTIKWMLANISESHTTTSMSVPAGAAGWGSNLNSTNTSFAYKLTVAGTYSYVCTIHVSSGMFGVINVTCPQGVADVNSNYCSAAYPMPFSTHFTIESSDADLITFYNIFGERLKTINVQSGQSRTEVNTAELATGIYFYSILREGVVIETRKVVKN